ncbi:The BTB (BR-C, ttk and bab)/POZ (Pox virus and Zinc finger) domain [Ceratobasidium sp. AG-Ba]|nr:The BTB (BR-C, ttk and bab)/POZ (Pox virus and Zinc finger) domain [Ceratobasidium sp. AG-Ba]QRW07313.1 The BTB (BR-C, ttk and bab)/POZ (Pox virus and Zinc finger) domain [Ceratobasidium sp. AG-Ba]
MSQPGLTEAHKNPGKKAQPKSPSTVKRHPEFCFDNTLIAIQIEDTLFNVHKYQLMKSTIFSDMFAIAEESQDPSKKQEGLSLDCPIVMKGVAASDFECLMRVLYASHFSLNQPEPAASLIVPAFRLANMWNFAELCAFLMPLAEKELGDVDKIMFAREFNLNGWLLPAHVNLCLRQKNITTEEANKLGINSLLLISRVREQESRASGPIHCANPNCSRTSHTCGGCGWELSAAGEPLLGFQTKAKVQEWLDQGGVLLD